MAWRKLDTASALDQIPVDPEVHYRATLREIRRNVIRADEGLIEPSEMASKVLALTIWGLGERP